MDGTLELKNQWGMLPNCFSLRIITSFKAVTPQILAISQCRNYNEVTIQIVPLIFIIYFNFSTFFFASSKGGALPPNPPPSPKSAFDLATTTVELLMITQ